MCPTKSQSYILRFLLHIKDPILLSSSAFQRFFRVFFGRRLGNGSGGAATFFLAVW